MSTLFLLSSLAVVTVGAVAGLPLGYQVAHKRKQNQLPPSKTLTNVELPHLPECAELELPYDPSAFWNWPDWSGGHNLVDPGTQPFWMLPPKAPEPKVSQQVTLAQLSQKEEIKVEVKPVKVENLSQKASKQLETAKQNNTKKTPRDFQILKSTNVAGSVYDYFTEHGTIEISNLRVVSKLQEGVLYSFDITHGDSYSTPCQQMMSWQTYCHLHGVDPAYYSSNGKGPEYYGY